MDTVPVETMAIFKERGKSADALERGLDQAKKVLADLPKVGLDLDAQTEQLEKEGVQKFIEPFGKLLDSVEKKRQAAVNEAKQQQYVTERSTLVEKRSTL
ncbi:MAG: transaldolase family protein, partial [Hymenobacter sp.]